jgi:hypothetical protein
MPDMLLGVLAIAVLQLAGAALYTWASPHDARDLWESLAVATFWWILAPAAVIRDIRRNWRYRHQATPYQQRGVGAAIIRAILRVRGGRG